MKILVVNVGSTSLKFKLFSFTQPPYNPEDVVSDGRIEGIGLQESLFRFSTKDGITREGTRPFSDYTSGIQAIIEFLTEAENRVLGSLDELSAVAFKTVHCGFVPEKALFLDEGVLQKMEEFSFVAPAHNPLYIRAIRTFKDLLPDKPMIGLFEPTFHRTKPPVAVHYGIPVELQEQFGIQRYGFHGASLRFIAERVPLVLGRSAEGLRIIACHLGGSSSICAIKDGKSIDTSMGFSPQSGVVHSTRPDDLDPFLVLYLMKKKNWSIDDAVEFLCKHCGLKGLSGLNTGEFKIIEEEAKKGNHRAQLAVDVFIYEVLKYIGAYFVVLGGVDVLVFTGGIGERSPYVRERICRGLEFLGLRLDDVANHKTIAVEKCISTSDSSITLLVIPTNEEFIVARSAAELLNR